MLDVVRLESEGSCIKVSATCTAVSTGFVRFGSAVSFGNNQIFCFSIFESRSTGLKFEKCPILAAS